MQSVFRELILFAVEAEDAEDAIRKVGQRFYDQGFVKETYIDAVAEREREYPTGLQLKSMCIAMPHTTGDHVIKPAVCIAKLKKPVTFAHMGDPTTFVEAQMLFMMAIQNPDSQLDLLQKVMNVFTNDEAAALYNEVEDEEALYNISKKYIG